MTTVTNPKTFTVNDPNATANQAAAFTILLSTASGGPYTAGSATVALSALTNSSGVYSGAMSLLNFSPALQNGVTYFAVAQADNATGPSGDSPEASFQVLAAPSAPLGLAFA